MPGAGTTPLDGIRFITKPDVDLALLKQLFEEAWPEHPHRDFELILPCSLTYVCAFAGEKLVGFVNVASDGAAHAFLLDVTVHPAFRRQGIATEIIRLAAAASRERGAEWLHVDYEPRLRGLYRKSGFGWTEAGLLRLGGASRRDEP
jgi:ribosomal protein S18 acetylase RimI-like enzyme